MDSIQHSQDIYQLFSVIAIHPEKKAALNKLHNNRQKWENDSLYVHLKLTKAVPTKQKPQPVHQNGFL